MITETLLLLYRKGLLDWPARETELLFLNAENTPALKELSLVPVQPRYDLAAPFMAAGYTVLTDIMPQHAQRFDTVWLLPGKDMEETQYLLAQAVTAVRTGGTIVAAAENNAGGKRLGKLFKAMGLSPMEESKNHARVVFATKTAQSTTLDWLDQGKEQAITSDGILSRPGLHSWNKPDKGSSILANLLPHDLTGTVADFGCGWGYLSLVAAEKSTNITRLTLADVDARAVDLAKRNIQTRHPSLPVETLWADLSRHDLHLGPFDVILLNPPFHEGTRAVPALGQAMITTASRALSPRGKLYLIANQHLPYEKTLHALFSRVDILAEENGFKALLCQKI